MKTLASAIEKTARAVGIEPCAPCNKRKESLEDIEKRIREAVKNLIPWKKFRK